MLDCLTLLLDEWHGFCKDLPFGFSYVLGVLESVEDEFPASVFVLVHSRTLLVTAREILPA